MTDASTTGAVERLIKRLMLNTPVITQDHMDAATEIMPQASRMIRALVAERDAAIQRAEAAERAEAAAWNDAIEAAVRVTLDRQGRRAMGDGHGNSSYDIGVSDAANAIRALRRAAPTEGEA